MEQTNPLVSVSIATRDRPALLARLLRCIQEQDFKDFECVVVDDDSSRETVDAYADIWRGLDSRFHLHLRPSSDRRRGQTVARNRAINLATGKYVAFCDDDDLWLTNDHLSNGVRALETHRGDLYFARLQISQSGEVVRPNFYAHASSSLTRHPVPGESDLFELSEKGRAALLRHHVLHCDTIIASRKLIHDCGLFWENLQLRTDRDFGMRLVDRAERVFYRSTLSADYDVTWRGGVSQSHTPKESALFNIMATFHAETVVRRPILRRVARSNRAWFLFELANAASAKGNYRHARELCIQSLLMSPTLSAARALATTCFKRDKIVPDA